MKKHEKNGEFDELVREYRSDVAESQALAQFYLGEVKGGSKGANKGISIVSKELSSAEIKSAEEKAKQRFAGIEKHK